MSGMPKASVTLLSAARSALPRPPGGERSGGCSGRWRTGGTRERRAAGALGGVRRLSRRARRNVVFGGGLQVNGGASLSSVATRGAAPAGVARRARCRGPSRAGLRANRSNQRRLAPSPGYALGTHNRSPFADGLCCPASAFPCGSVAPHNALTLRTGERCRVLCWGVADAVPAGHALVGPLFMAMVLSLNPHGTHLRTPCWWLSRTCETDISRCDT